MAINMSKFGTYIRGGATAIAGLYAVAFVVLNARRTANVWLFIGVDLKAAPTLLVIAVTAVLSIALTWLLRHFLGWRRRRHGSRDAAGR